ncbi:MAG: toprim domain-containing protein [Bacilli bacterium]|jgi:ribonuclease M5
MRKVSNVIIVEGPTDAALVNTILHCIVEVTGGAYVSRETINYYKELSKLYPILVLTDPDQAGEKIALKIKKEIPKATIINLNKKDCIKKDDLGVANCSKETLLKTLNPYLVEGDINHNKLTMIDLIELNLSGENSNKLREYVCKTFNIGRKLTTKTFLKRLNALQITKRQIIEILK